MKSFASDNYAGAHPDVLAALTAANEGHAVSYGADPWTARAQEVLRGHFGPEAETLLVFNGSGANVLALRAVCRPWDAVICAESAHVNVDEGGAPERIAGVKLLTVATSDGKLTPDDVRARVTRVGDEHAVQPRLVTITQSTEFGTRYTPAEMTELAATTHELGLLLHVDGSRLANAAAGLNCGLADITAGTGVDVLSLGGTKNGMVLGEAVVFLTPVSPTARATCASRPSNWPPSTGSSLPSSWLYSRATCGDATPRTPTRWRRGSPATWPRARR